MGNNSKFFSIDIASHQVLYGDAHEMELIWNGLGLGLFDDLG